MYIVEGCISFCLAPITFYWLPNSAVEARWLTEDERGLGALRIELNKNKYDPEEQFFWSGIWHCVKDWKLYIQSISHFGIDTTLYCLTTFMPTIITGLGFTSNQLAATYNTCVFCRRWFIHDHGVLLRPAESSLSVPHCGADLLSHRLHHPRRIVHRWCPLLGRFHGGHRSIRLHLAKHRMGGNKPRRLCQACLRYGLRPARRKLVRCSKRFHFHCRECAETSGGLLFCHRNDLHVVCIVRGTQCLLA